MFEQLELIKGHTPDKGADSLGGTINLKSRSPLSMREKRRVTYNASGALGAAVLPSRFRCARSIASHPLLNVGYQEVFDVFGGERNLGVAVNLFYSENVAGWFRTTRDFQNTTSAAGLPLGLPHVGQLQQPQAAEREREDRLPAVARRRSSRSTRSTTTRTRMLRRRYETRAFTNQIGRHDRHRRHPARLHESHHPGAAVHRLELSTYRRRARTTSSLGCATSISAPSTSSEPLAARLHRPLQPDAHQHRQRQRAAASSRTA